MKYKLVNISVFIIISISTVLAQRASSGYNCIGGVYYTYDDFLKNKIENLGIVLSYNLKEVTFEKPDPTMTTGPQKFIFKYKENKIWGFRKTDGTIFRVDNVDHKIYNLITAGSYYLWADYSTFVGRDEKGTVNWVQITFYVGENISKHLYISKEGNGELLNCNYKNLKELFKNDPEILAEIEANPIKVKDEKALQNSINNLVKWVDLYNKKNKN